MRKQKITLAVLLAERNRALIEAKSSLCEIQGFLVHGIDKDLKSIATSHPWYAMGGAVVAGIGAGLVLRGGTIRHLTRGAAHVVLGPFIENLVQRFIRLASGEEDREPESQQPEA